jgi:hypothetical protein
MPDGDTIVCTLGPRWRRAYRMLKAGAPEREIVDALQWASARHVHDTQGLPELSAFAEIYLAASRGEIRREEAINRCERVARGSGDSRNAWIASRAVARSIVDLAGGSRPSTSAEGVVSGASFRELIRSEFFARAETHLIGTRFQTLGEAEATKSNLLSLIESDLARMSDQLVRMPTGEQVHARRIRRLSVRSTADILNEPIEV